MENFLIHAHTLHRFAWLDLVSEFNPHETPVLAFHHLLEKRKFGEHACTTVKAHLKERGMTMKQGTEIDTILLVTLSSTPTEAGCRAADGT